MCASCQQSGPQVQKQQRRWLLRGEGMPRNSLSADEIQRLLESGIIDAQVTCAREGGEWLPFFEHPDFREQFFPGSPQDIARRERQEQARRVQSADDRRKRNRQLAAVGFAVASLGLAVVATTNNLFVISAETTDQISNRVNRAVNQVMVAEDAIIAELPPLALLEDLPSPKSVKDGLPLLIYQGRQGLLSGTASGVVQARESFEKAVALSPTDPEALGGLAEVYANLLPSQPSLLNPMTALLTRAQSLAPNSPTSLRALAAAEMAEDNLAMAAKHAFDCGQPLEQVGTGNADLGCAMIFAESRGDRETLMALRERFPGVGGIDLALARVAIAQNSWEEALQWGEEISRAHPTEETGWSTQLVAAASVGNWSVARSSGDRLMALEGNDPKGLQTYAQVMLRVYNKPLPAVTALERLMGQPSFATYIEAPQVLVVAAEVETARENWAAAEAYARQAVEADAGPSAKLLLAYALMKTDQKIHALEVMSSLDIGSLISTTEASLHLGAARLYLELGDQRGAETELDSAWNADAWLLSANIDRAIAKLQTNDVSGAIDALINAAYSDAILPRREMRLSAVWLPPENSASLPDLFATGILNDARLVSQEAELRAVVSWIAGEPSGQQKLEAAVEEGSSLAAAALSQVYVDQNRCREAIPLIEMAVNSRPGSVPLMAMYGYCLAKEGRESARRATEQAISKDGDSPSALYWGALAIEQLDGPDKAREAWLNFLRASPDNVLGQEAMVRLQSN